MKTASKNIPFGKPIIGEAEKKAVLEVLEGPVLTHGPKASSFEAAFAAWTKAPYAVSVSSCTAALHLSYFHFGIREGDEVIVPAQTHVATAHAVEFCGAKPVFVDAEVETGNIDVRQIEGKISPRTRAISVTHFLGMPVDMETVCQIAKKHGLIVIEDCALAIGTSFKGIHAGLHGDAGCFSFYPVKHFTTAEGGMLVTKQKEVAEAIVRKKAFGVDRHVGERTVPGVYDVTMLGFNYRMNEIQAALGIEQLKRIDDFLARRKQNHEVLSQGLSEVDEISTFRSSHGDFQSSYYCFSIVLKRELFGKRYDIIMNLKEKGIGTSVYYPKPVPHLQYYKEKYGCRDTDFPVAGWISDGSISLPVGPHLNPEDMRYIAESVKSAIHTVYAK